MTPRVALVPRVRRARLRACGATPYPLGNTGMAARYTRSGCLVLIAERPVVAGVQPTAGSADRGPRCALPAGDGSPVSGYTLSLLPRRPHSPADARSDLRLQSLRAGSASVDRRSRGASHTAAIAPLGARVLRGKPLRAPSSSTCHPERSEGSIAGRVDPSSLRSSG
jgi:hypothetical protein